METLTDRELAIKLAWQMWGMSYLWAGDDAIAGFDCSGMIVEILKSTGQLPRDGDWTAQSLFDLFKYQIVVVPRAGCLVFWGQDLKSITHIEMMIDDLRTIGASGGGSKTRTAQDAIRQNAYVKIRPLASRSAPVAVVDPFWDGMNGEGDV